MPDERRGSLIDAAAAVFLEKGVGATRIEDIVARAAVAKGTFYHYFPDRTALLEALRQRHMRHYGAIAADAMDERARRDWDGRLEAWTRSTIRAYTETYALHDAIFHDPVVCQRCVSREEPLVIKLTGLLQEAANEGVWRADDAMLTAAFMFHGLHGLLDDAANAGQASDAVLTSAIQLFKQIAHVG